MWVFVLSVFLHPDSFFSCWHLSCLSLRYGYGTNKQKNNSITICVKQSSQHEASIHCWHEFMWPVLANGAEIQETVPSCIYRYRGETDKELCPESFQHCLESCWKQQKGPGRSHNFPVGMVADGNSRWVLIGLEFLC